MICSRCERVRTHGSVFVKVGEPEEGKPRVYICGRCFTERPRIEPGEGRKIAPTPERASVPPEWLTGGVK